MSPSCQICDRKLALAEARLCIPCRTRLLAEQRRDGPALLAEARAMAQRLRRMNPWSQLCKRA